jgi:hypothetical protein
LPLLPPPPRADRRRLLPVRRPPRRRRLRNPLKTRRNSEIYNHEALKARYLPGVAIPTTSDSAIPGYLHAKYGGVTNAMLNDFDGMYTCVLYDEATGEYTAFRDPIGVCPLYWGKSADGAVWFASEMKALQDVCVSFDIFPPARPRRRAAAAPCARRLPRGCCCFPPPLASARRQRSFPFFAAAAACPSG